MKNRAWDKPYLSDFKQSRPPCHEILHHWTITNNFMSSECKGVHCHFWTAQFSQQSNPCPPETVNPACTSTPVELECIHSEENLSAEPEKEQEMAHEVGYLPEGEDSYVEDSYVEDLPVENDSYVENSCVEDLPVENAVPSPAQSDPSSKELQGHRRQCRRPKVFTYDRLGSPACYNIKAPPLHTNLKQQSNPCPPETVNPACTSTPVELECIHSEENLSAEPEKEQEMAHEVGYLPEGEDSYVEDSYVEDLPVENDSYV
ncbi:hypothetical protein F7725_010723 [Dissostichus mawsoni]|uniref:Uncharacterized protein n=1 Tax=Dissostichus mawsoni TaxID=36200 RepID=A0A7J5XP97_DISMA|nr:hypothetical protein F7725_010723 [Dissostichus mawsoni]